MTLPRLIGLAPIAPACLRAVWELARARLQLASLSPRDIAALNEATSSLPQHARCDMLESSRESLVGQVAFVIPRIAARLPFRSDCLIQAIAARNWLSSRQIHTTIAIGVDRDDDKQFLAHAWLYCGDRIVTGGDITRFSPLLGTGPDRLSR